jgi:hypothetical protein
MTGEWMMNASNIWHLNGNSTDSIAANNGTDTDITYTAGKFGQGASLNGASSKIVIGTELSDSTGSFTCWFKTSSNAAQTIYSQSQTTGGDRDRIEIQLAAGGQLEFHIAKATVTLIDVYSNSSFKDEKWHWLAVVVGAASNLIYVDGSLQAVTYVTGAATTTGWFGTISADTTTKDIGTLNIQGTYYNWFDGYLDEIAYFGGRVLTTKEIKDYYSWATGRKVRII